MLSFFYKILEETFSISFLESLHVDRVVKSRVSLM